MFVSSVTQSRFTEGCPLLAWVLGFVRETRHLGGEVYVKPDPSPSRGATSYRAPAEPWFLPLCPGPMEAEKTVSTVFWKDLRPRGPGL